MPAMSSQYNARECDPPFLESPFPGRQEIASLLLKRHHRCLSHTKAFVTDPLCSSRAFSRVLQWSNHDLSKVDVKRYHTIKKIALNRISLLAQQDRAEVVVIVPEWFCVCGWIRSKFQLTKPMFTLPASLVVVGILHHLETGSPRAECH